MKTEPTKEHEWLQRLVGEWTSEMDAVMEPGQPAIRFKGTESVRSLGGLWTVAEGQSEMPGGGTAITMMTLGYDSRKKRYVGTFIGSMMDYLWIYDGEVNAAGDALSLYAEGPGADGKMLKFRDVIEFKSDDHRMLISHSQDKDGKWQPFMTANYRRIK